MLLILSVSLIPATGVEESPVTSSSIRRQMRDSEVVPIRFVVGTVLANVVDGPLQTIVKTYPTTIGVVRADPAELGDLFVVLWRSDKS